MWRLELADEAGWPERAAALDPGTRDWLAALGFAGRHRQVALVPGDAARPSVVFAGTGCEPLDHPLTYAFLPRHLPAGIFEAPADACCDALALGWALGSYRFAQYKECPAAVQLVQPQPPSDTTQALIRAECGARDWINRPASDLGPDALVRLVIDELAPLGAQTRCIAGVALGEQGFPCVLAAGQGSARPPAVVEAVWGDPHAPKVTLVGKGVCFDSGGLNAKPPAEALTMKADMAGAAHVLALARLLIGVQLPIRLRVIIAAIDNMPSGAAMRNGDILVARNRRSIEIGHSDYEGRLILADTLAWAAEDSPALLIDIATLTDTGLGPEIAGFFTADDALAAELVQAAGATHDPVWRLPLWGRYRSEVASGVADLSNIGSSQSTITSIAAALFLREFADGATCWLHLDIEGWNGIEPGDRPHGGNVVGLRTLFHALCARYYGRTSNSA